MQKYTAEFITTDDLAFQFAQAKGWVETIQETQIIDDVETIVDIPNPITIHAYICQYMKELLSKDLNTLNEQMLEVQAQEQINAITQQKQSTIESYKEAMDNVLQVTSESLPTQ